MVDDVLTISTCGLQGTKVNSALNAFIEGKKLRLSHDKSQQLHVSKLKTSCELNLKVHEKTMQKIDEIVYLGDKFTEKGTVEETLKMRKLKSVGIISQICSILKNVTLGVFYFKTALILRESIFLNGILTNSEAWNFISLKGQFYSNNKYIWMERG